MMHKEHLIHSIDEKCHWAWGARNLVFFKLWCMKKEHSELWFAIFILSQWNAQIQPLWTLELCFDQFYSVKLSILVSFHNSNDNSVKMMYIYCSKKYFDFRLYKCLGSIWATGRWVLASCSPSAGWAFGPWWTWSLWPSATLDPWTAPCTSRGPDGRILSYLEVQSEGGCGQCGRPLHWTRWRLPVRLEVQIDGLLYI